MSRSQEVRNTFQDRLAKVETLRDQIRLDLHLASMELRDEWRKLEKRLPSPVLASEQLKELTGESVEKLAGELAKFRARLLDGQNGPLVAAFMTTAIATCAGADSAAHAIGTMWRQDVGFLPVVDTEQKVIGVITDRDIAVAAWSRGQRLEEIPVFSVMSATVHACGPSDEARVALTLMRNHQLRRLPILGEGGRLVGLVTLSDLARTLGGDGSAASTGPRQVVDTFLGIVTPPQERHTSAN